MYKMKALRTGVLVVLLTAAVSQAQVPRPTLTINGVYAYQQGTDPANPEDWHLAFSNMLITQVEYLDGSISSTDPITNATFDLTPMKFLYIHPTYGDAVFTNGRIVVSDGVTTFFTATLAYVRLTEYGFGDFGNINEGFQRNNVVQLAFGENTGSRFVEEFAELIAPAGVPDVGKVQLEVDLVFAPGGMPATFAENFQVASYGSVLGVFDGAPVIDDCPNDPSKTAPGACGCGVPDTDTDGDTVPDCNDECPNDAAKIHPGVCGCGILEDDGDEDGTPDCVDQCPDDAAKVDPGLCGCGVADLDSDADGTPDCLDGCPGDPAKAEPGDCGCGTPDFDSDGDGVADCNDDCAEDAGKIEPGICGCGIADTDSDADGTPDCNDPCAADPNKTDPGVCGCGVSDADSDGDSIADCNDGCPGDVGKALPGVCGCGIADTDTDGDGVLDCQDGCDNDPDKVAPGVCGCGVADTDSDGDGVADCIDSCPGDPTKIDPGICGCGVADADSDGDGVADCNDACPNDPMKTSPGICGCGVADADSDGDGVADCNDACPNDPGKTAPGQCDCGTPDTDSDGDGVADCNDACPDDAGKTEPGQCDCGVADVDSDNDGVADCNDRCAGEPDIDPDNDGLLNCEDGCPDDGNKAEPGQCGCGVPDVDSDGDGTADCVDRCPSDSGKTEPGVCGCGIADADSDGDGTADCNDGCPDDPAKVEPGVCDCSVADTDTDGDGTADCNDSCVDDPGKIEPGVCGCGVADTDSDADGVEDCVDACPGDPDKIEPGICGCGFADADSDGDGTADCNDGCPNDAIKTVPGVCGCGVADTDSDGDGTADCNDLCPSDAGKTAPGDCGCGVAETDTDGDGTADCVDGCPADPAKTSPGLCGCGVEETGDADGDGVVDCNDGCPADPNKTEPGPCGCGVAEVDGDADGVPDCLCNMDLNVEACIVPPAPAVGTDCQGKVIRMTLEYAGGGCAASSHTQDARKVRCSGNAGTTEPVRIVVSDKKGNHGWSMSDGKRKNASKKMYANVEEVTLGGLIQVEAANAGREILQPDVRVRVYDAGEKLIEDVIFHTSCSQPLNVGDRFGSFRVVAMTTTEGGDSTLPVEAPVECLSEIPRTLPPHCEGKVMRLQLRYTGGGCSATNHTQDPGNVDCEMGAGIVAPVRIVVKDGETMWLDTGVPADVMVGGVVDVLAAAADASHLNPNTTVEIYSAMDEIIERVSFHTSCSQPLNLADQFGSLQVVGIHTTEGGFDTLGAEVDYTYTLTNNGLFPLANVALTDAIFGVVSGSPIAVLDPGQTVTLTLSAYLFDSLTNTVTASSDLGEAGVCSEADTATVTIEQPPQPPVMCTSRIQSMLLKYTGPTVQGATVTVVTTHVAGDLFKKCDVEDQYKGQQEHVVVYENIDLISGETVLRSVEENGWTIDATSRCQKSIGPNTSIFISGVEEVIHTSCSAPFVTLQPAPLNEPRGEGSPNWLVVDFTQK